MLRTQENTVSILMIDDDQAAYELVKTMFTKMSIACTTDWVRDYDEALARIQARGDDYDAFLIDYRLEGRTGLDLLREPAVQQSDVPAILLTNASDGEIDMAALEAGAADYINKSKLEFRTLERTIRYALDRAQTLRQLRQSEARYRAIVEDQPDMIIRFSPAGEITFANHAYCRFRDRTSQKLIGTSYLAPILAKDQHLLTALLDEPQSSQMAQEVRVQTDDGKEYWQQWTTRPIHDDDGHVLEYQSVIRDITERKQVENALNARLDQLRTLRRVDTELTETLKIDSVVSLALDSAMRLSAADIAFMALYQDERLKIVRSYGVSLDDLSEMQVLYDRQQGIIGRVMARKKGVYIADMHADPDCAPTLPQMRSQILIPLLSQEMFLGMISLETKRPERFNREIFEFLELVTARIAVSIDNARLYDLLKTRLEELEDLYAQVSDLEQLKTDMIHIAAHDLRNPIGIMQYHTDMLQNCIDEGKYAPEQFSEYLSIIDNASRRMHRITTDILTLEKFERGEMANQIVNITPVLMEVIDEHRHVAAAKQQTYIVDVPDIPTYIRGDGAQLREAAANLIGNAIKYTPEEGRIEIVLEDDGDAAIFEVHDTGYGIPYEMQARLFQPFYRVKTKETAGIDGTGLGLHLVKGIVQRHKGRMIFHSRYKEGSTFGFQIPTAERDGQGDG